MDIPNSGAIFTLGKSHLAENTQSYFYIKNDPIKRLVSGPNQSAVICESGRLFVWGENRYGQLGIGGNNNSNNNNNNGDIVTKPTCVKSLKTLGLKVADVAFGSDWAVILTHSNELFFTGRSIFADDTNVARNFSAATVANEPCAIIRKPFRLEEFDDCLSTSEDAENFVTVLAGNKHFAVMTSFGRLIAWGSNQNHQLGTENKGPLLQPHEIRLDTPIQQFTCGPVSTLVLTESGHLYLTGRLNEFSFSQFTELQKNLSATEQIIFMHISNASEIYIVTNAGSIYRSIESARNKSLIFQRFYDYDSEEHGPIWKLLKGLSFFTVLTKAHKFYTTFSESGHHLKTFREISKFKNLRLLDMAVGDQHVLVHGIPRSSTLSATVGPMGTHRYMSRTYVMTATEKTGGSQRETAPEKTTAEKVTSEQNGNQSEQALDSKETPKPNTPVHDNENGAVEAKVLIKHTAVAVGKTGNTTDTEEYAEEGFREYDKRHDGLAEVDEHINAQAATAIELNGNENRQLEVAKTKRNTSAGSNSPTESIKSRKSVRSIKFDPAARAKSGSSDKLLRPRTPYPENSTGNTPQTIKKTPLRNFSYEAAMEQEFLEQTSPALADSLENIPESVADEMGAAPVTAVLSTPTPPSEEDEQLTVEISGTMDELDRTIVVNEIRFINNGVDVTAHVKEKALDTEEESTADSLEDSVEEVRRDSEDILHKMEQEIEEQVDQVTAMKNDVKDRAKETTEEMTKVLDKRLDQAGNIMQTAVVEAEHARKEAVTGAENAMEKAASEAEATMQQAATEADTSMQQAANSARAAVKKATTGAEFSVQKAASDAGESMQKAATGARDAVQKAATNAGDAMQKAATGARDAVQKATTDAGEAMQKAATGARDTVNKATTSASDAVQKAATGARDTADTMGENAKHMASDALQAVEHAGSNAAKAAGGAKNAVENALFKMADGTKYAVDTVASKISSEMQGARGNLASLLHGKSGKKTPTPDDDEELSSDTHSKDGGAKTNTTTPGEDDERTTASVNSTHTSAGNPFERGNRDNPFEASNPFNNELDDAMARGKKTLRDEVQAVEHRADVEVEHGKGKMSKFFSDMRAKGRGLSCRNEKAIRIDDDYRVEEQHNGQNHNVVATQNQNTSKVCSIL